jgi:hypothetical protein
MPATASTTTTATPRKGEVDNKTWSATFTYTLGGSAFLLGHQRVSDDGGFVFLNQGSLVNDNGNAEVPAAPASTPSPTPPWAALSVPVKTPRMVSTPMTSPHWACQV